MTLDQQFLEDVATTLYVGYNYSYTVDATTYYTTSVPNGSANDWRHELQKWKNLAEEEKQVWRDKASVWLEAYQQRYPHHYDKIIAGWKKIDW